MPATFSLTVLGKWTADVSLCSEFPLDFGAIRSLFSVSFTRTGIFSGVVKLNFGVFLECDIPTKWLTNFRMLSRPSHVDPMPASLLGVL